MSGAPRPDPRGNVDRGTELGAGTRLLASVFRLPVRATLAIGRGFSHLGRIGRRGRLIAAIVVVVLGLAAVAVFDSPATAGIVAAAPVVIVLTIAVFAVIPTLLMVGAIKAAPHVGRAFVRVARYLWRGIGPSVRAIAAIAVSIAHAAIHVARAVAFATVLVARAVMVVARPILHAIAVAARAIGHAIAAIAVSIAHAAVHVARAVAFATVLVARAVMVVARPIGHAIAVAARAIGHAITSVVVSIVHAVASVAARIASRVALMAEHAVSAFVAAARAFDRAVGSATLALGRAFVFVFAPIGRCIKHAASSVQRFALTPIGHAIAAVFLAFARAITSAVARVTALVRIGMNWVRTRVLRIRHSVGVAAAQARHASAATVAPATRAEATRAAAPPPPFSAEAFHNEYLPTGSRTVDAVITVTAHADSAGPAPTAEVILVDCSGSMGHPWRKIRAARGATVAAIEALPDGALFAVVRANHDADVVYPTHGGLAIKTAQTAVDARRAVQMLWPEGGTAMGRWLLVARELLASAPHAIGHTILLTDGKNESERPDELVAAVRACRGRFQCDCRGVGTDWDIAELRGIAQQLLGTVDIVADPADLAADFHAMAERAAAKRVDGVTLRVWTPVESTVGFIKQVSPSIEDLEVHPIRIDARTVDYPTGAWSDESRDYHLSIQLPDKPAGTEMLAARVTLVVGDRVLSKALVTATWTDDLELSTRIVPEVVHYTGQAALLGAVQDGLERRRAGDEAGALSRLGEAARRAHETGNEATLQLIAKVVDIEDAPTGRVRARAVVDDADVMALDTRSTRTKRFAPVPSPETETETETETATEPVPSVSSD